MKTTTTNPHQVQKMKFVRDGRVVNAIATSAAVAAFALLAGCASSPTPSNITVGEALAVPDDSKVVVTGQVVQQIDSDHYLLRDNTGSITAQIDESLLGKVKIAPDARLRVGGSVDQ